MPPSTQSFPNASGPILIFSFCHGAGSGAERVLEHLLTAAAQAGERPPLVIVAPDDSGVCETARHLEFNVLPWPSRLRTSLASDMPAAIAAFPGIRRLRPALLHAWHSRCYEIVGLYGRLLRVPAVGTLHDHPRPSSSSQARRALMKFGAEQMRCMACVSEATEREAHAAKWDVPTCVIRNGLPAVYTAIRSTPGHPFRVAFLGCAEEWKGVDVVLDLASRMDAERFRWNLYGPQTSGSSKRLQNSLPAGITMHGPERPDVIFSSNDLVLHPSRKFDPFPTVLLEAARSGIPAVATRVGGSAEIVRDGETGFLIEVDDQASAAARIDQLAGNPEQWLRMSQRAMEHFSSSFPVGKMLEGYRAFWSRFCQ